MNKILAYRDLLDDQVNEETVGRAIRDMLKKSNDFAPTPKIIVSYICNYFNVDEDTLRGQTRSRDVVAARQIAIYLIRRMSGMSLNDIGKEFGGQGSLHHHALAGQGRKADAHRPGLRRKGEGDHHQHQQQEVKRERGRFSAFPVESTGSVGAGTPCPHTHGENRGGFPDSRVEKNPAAARCQGEFPRLKAPTTNNY